MKRVKAVLLLFLLYYPPGYLLKSARHFFKNWEHNCSKEIVAAFLLNLPEKWKPKNNPKTFLYLYNPPTLPQMKKSFFRMLSRINQKVLPSYSKQQLDLQKATKFQKALIGWKLWVTKKALN